MPNADELFERGSRDYRSGRYEDAERWFRQHLAVISDQDGRAYGRAAYSLGLALMKLERIDEALDMFDTALEADPSLDRAQKRIDELAEKYGYADVEVVAPLHRGGIVGIAHAVQQRSESDSMIRGQGSVILSFRLETFDETGNPAGVAAVRLEGSRIVGTVLEGDWVELPPTWRPGKSLGSVLNRSTGEEVQARNTTLWVQRIVLAVFLAAILLFIVYVNLNIGSGRR